MCMLSAALLEAVLWSRRASASSFSLAEVNSLDRWPTPSYVHPDEDAQTSESRNDFPIAGYISTQTWGFQLSN